MLQAASAWMVQHRDRLNRENVFPVPDGDTGTNLALTLQAAVDAIRALEADSVAAVWSRAARGALAGSRGNSGVILSQYMQGFADVITGAGYLDPTVLRSALQVGSGQGFGRGSRTSPRDHPDRGPRCRPPVPRTRHSTSLLANYC